MDNTWGDVRGDILKEARLGMLVKSVPAPGMPVVVSDGLSPEEMERRAEIRKLAVEIEQDFQKWILNAGPPKVGDEWPGPGGSKCVIQEIPPGGDRIIVSVRVSPPTENIRVSFTIKDADPPSD